MTMLLAQQTTQRSIGLIVLVIVALGGVVLYLVQSRRHPGAEPSVYVPGREWKPESAVDSEEFYQDADDDDDEAAAATPAAAASR